MNKLNLLPILYLLTDASLEDLLVLLQFFFQFLCKLHHAKFIGSTSVILAIALYDICSLFCRLSSLMLDPERIILFKGLVSEPWTHLENEVSHVAEPRWIFEIAELYVKAWFCKSLRLEETVLALQKNTVTILQNYIYVDLSFFIHLLN